MRRPTYAAVRAAWALALLPAWGLPAGCLAGPRPADVLAVGFRTPEQTLRTFQTALRGDLVGLEYRCLSADFKRRHGISQLVYETARERLAEEEPFFEQTARARVVEREDLAPDRVRLAARVELLWFERDFDVFLVREEFYETFDREGLIEDDHVLWTDVASVWGGELRVTLPMPEGVPLAELLEVRLGREWKIDGFQPRPEPPPPPRP